MNMSIQPHREAKLSVRTAGIASDLSAGRFLCRFRFNRGTRLYRGKAAQRARFAQALVSFADNDLEAYSARSHLEQSSQVEVEWQPRCQAVMPSRSFPKTSLAHWQREDKMLEQALVSGADNCLKQTPHARTWNNPRRWRWSRGGVAATLSGEAVAILP